jgi:hypothetical protein
MFSLVTDLFFLVFLLNQWWSPPLRFQVSDCNTFCIMCDVPSTAVFCSESIECFPGMGSNFFFKAYVTIPVTPTVTRVIIHFMFHIHCITIHELLHLLCFLLPFVWHSCPLVLPHLLVCTVSFFLLLIIICGLFAATSLSVCTPWFRNTVTSCSHSSLGVCVPFVCCFSAQCFIYWVM